MKPDAKRILVVDDRSSHTQLLKRHLEQNDAYLVREENDSKSALATAEEFRPDLIFLDVMMPGLDGGDLAATFRGHPSLKDVPIVFLTAVVSKNEAQDAGGRIGGFPFLAKPIVLTEVTACVRHHLGS